MNAEDEIREISRKAKERRQFLRGQSAYIKIIKAIGKIKKFNTGKKLRYWQDTDTDESNARYEARFLVEHKGVEKYWDVRDHLGETVLDYIGCTVKYRLTNIGGWSPMKIDIEIIDGIAEIQEEIEEPQKEKIIYEKQNKSCQNGNMKPDDKYWYLDNPDKWKIENDQIVLTYDDFVKFILAMKNDKEQDTKDYSNQFFEDMFNIIVTEVEYYELYDCFMCTGENFSFEIKDMTDKIEEKVVEKVENFTPYKNEIKISDQCYTDLLCLYEDDSDLDIVFTYIKSHVASDAEKMFKTNKGFSVLIKNTRYNINVKKFDLACT